MIRMAPRISLVLLLFMTAVLAQTPSRKAAPKAPAPASATPAPTLSVPAPVTSPAPAQTFSIDSIAVEGARIHTPEAILAAAGLKQGEKGGSDIFDAARDRLLASGYFETVAYRYKPSPKGGFEVTFEVQEFAQLFPIRVEALPVTTAETVALLKSKDPLYGAAMPGTEPAVRRAAVLIEEYIKSKHQLASVAGRVVATDPGKFEIQFTPGRGLPAVAEVVFDGSKLISATDLRNSIAEVAFGQPYTENGFRSFLDSQIGPLYEAKGHLHVTYPKITTEASTRVTGLDVKVVIDEGPEYKLTRVALAGTPGDSARILRAAKLPQMTIANFAEVRQAATRVSDYLRSRGYLDNRVTTEKQLDEKKLTAELFIVVEPGPVYTFGTLAVNGLGLDGEAAIRKMWGLGAGDAFPGDYATYFASKVKEESMFDNLADITAVKQIRKGTQIVDVVIDFKAAPPKPLAPRRQPGEIPGPH